MRPVKRGDAPPGATTYEKMRQPLRDALGEYCSYCEFPVAHAAHTQHAIPKDQFHEWRDRWDNLLISCQWCNSHKPKKIPAPETVDDYLWPTRDNTARAFSYANVIPEVSEALTGEVRNKAARLRGLVQLGHPSDKRAKKRAEAFSLARHYFSRLATSADPDFVRDSIVGMAKAMGFFSVFMEVCRTDPSLRRSLIKEFKGTAPDCYHPETTLPVQRPGGRL